MTGHFVLLLLLATLIAPTFAQESVSFDVRKLAVDANEGIAAADINGDGVLTGSDFNAWLNAFSAGCGL